MKKRSTFTDTTFNPKPQKGEIMNKYKYTYVSEIGTRIGFNNLDDGKEDCLEFGGYIIDNKTGKTVYFVSDGVEDE